MLVKLVMINMKSKADVMKWNINVKVSEDVKVDVDRNTTDN